MSPPIDFHQSAGVGSHSLVFLCDQNGEIVRDLGETLLSWGESISARSLIDVIEADSFQEFLKYIRTQGAALGWQSLVYHMGSHWSLSLNGSCTPSGILVFAHLSPASTALDESAYNAADEETARKATALDKLRNAELRKAVHDLKNPISSILGSCDFLSAYSHDQLDQEQVEIIAGIEASARTLLQLTSRIYRLCYSDEGSSTP
jgi:signal transduction histidine kinase